MTNINSHNRLLTYAHNQQGSLVFIDDVSNGLSCNCTCPCCKEQLIAKNGGKKKEHHFAHIGGSNCQGYYETTLHLLSKEIIRTKKTIMLPQYKIFESKRIDFENVEIEERNDNSSLQPDCVGITKDGLRLHIEICVTHQVDDYKKSKIKEENINCIEIKIPRDFPLDKEKLENLIVNCKDSREWINYPYGEELFYESQKKQIILFREQHPESKAWHIERCYKCKVRIETAQKKYIDFINSYKNRILSWAIPFTNIPPKEILYQDLHLRYTRMNHHPYLLYKDKKYWIYPKDNKYENSNHRLLCNSTYGFFKKLYYICSYYIDCMEFTSECPYYVNEFEYKGQFYVFCNFKP